MNLSVKSIARGILATGLLSLTLVACGDNTATVPAVATTAPAAATTKAVTTGGTTAAGATTTTGTAQDAAKTIQALKDMGKNLDESSAALQKNDLAAAKAAYKKFDDNWDGVEDYVKQFDPKQYQAIEEAMTPVGRELLRNADTTVATVTPLLKTLSDTYNNTIKQMAGAMPGGTGPTTPTS